MCGDNYSNEFESKFIYPVKSALENIPNSVSLEVTTRCQLDCVYCNRDKDNIKDLRLEDVPLILKHIKGVENIVICGMGESFCYSHIYDLLELLKDYRITIITNGSIKIDFKKLEKCSNVKLLVFSIDAANRNQLEKICRGYRFDVLKENLTELRRHPQIIGVINATFVSDNITEVSNIVCFAKENGLQAVNFGLPIGNTDFVKNNKEEIKKSICEGEETAKHLGVIFNPFYRISCHSKKRIQPVITIGGEFYACCNLINHNDSIGNIFESDLCDIWQKAIEKIKSNEDCYSCELVKNMWNVMG